MLLYTYTLNKHYERTIFNSERWYNNQCGYCSCNMLALHIMISYLGARNYAGFFIKNTCMNKKQRRYNHSTGCYKIDVFIDGVYLWSTDQHKSCKSAKERAIELKPTIDPKLITAKFFYEQH